MIEIVVLVAVALRLTQSYSVDDARVVERVGDDGVVLFEQRFEHAAVGIETRREQNGVVGAQELAEASLEGAVGCLGATDETHRRHPVTEFVDRGVSYFEQGRMIGETEVVVGTQVDQVGSAR